MCVSVCAKKKKEKKAAETPEYFVRKEVCSVCVCFSFFSLFLSLFPARLYGRYQVSE